MRREERRQDIKLRSEDEEVKEMRREDKGNKWREE